MKTELKEYEGLWVCLCEDEVVASADFMAMVMDR